ncbi:MAG: asparaginase [Gemmatimonadota bacterium]
MNPLRICLERAGEIESVHEVHAVVVSRGEAADVRGDADRRAFWRSSMKPFQAIPVVRGGVLEGLGLGEVELAVVCASHHGLPVHIDAVGRILAAAGASEGDLACGPHRPLDEDAARALDAVGRLPGRIHNNCSGKHAAMIASALSTGCDVSGYHEFDHPVQANIREALTEWLGPNPASMHWGVDGCGVPTPRLSVGEMAEAYARFVRSDDPAAVAVATAMTGNPNMISGPTALSTAIMSTTGGRVLAKEGAEGVFCLGGRVDGWAAAFKVSDGAMRALGPAIIHTLARRQLLSELEQARLERFACVTISNTRGEPVATVRAMNDDD